MQCYKETPISVHKFLPIVSLGNEEDKNISWGDCLTDGNGNYYYTSFSPVGFVVPYFLTQLLNLPINVQGLYVVNSIMYVVSFILIAYIFNKLFSKHEGIKNYTILFTGLIYLFQIEVMHSQGIVFWVQSIFQVLLAIQYILFMHYKNKKAKIAFYFMCLLMPYAEWTGYISNVGFAIILFIKRIKENKKLTIKAFIEPMLIGVITICSFILFSAHFLLNLNLKEYLFMLKRRFFMRSLNSELVTFEDLLNGYFVSYKYTLLLCMVLLISILSLKQYRQKFLSLIKEYKYEIIFFAFILLENIIMLQHAVAYTFDRLKFIYILILMFHIMLTTIIECNEQGKKFIINLFIIVCAIISIVNLNDYKNLTNIERKEEPVYKGISIYKETNKKMVQYIEKRFDYSNSLLCSSYGVRGYINLLFNRGIYEYQTYESAHNIAKQKQKQYIIYIQPLNEIEIPLITIKDIFNNIRQDIYILNGQLIIGEEQSEVI